MMVWESTKIFNRKDSAASAPATTDNLNYIAEGYDTQLVLNFYIYQYSRP